jgi:hypothetical protein
MTQVLTKLCFNLNNIMSTSNEECMACAYQFNQLTFQVTLILKIYGVDMTQHTHNTETSSGQSILYYFYNFSTKICVTMTPKPWCHHNVYMSILPGSGFLKIWQWHLFSAKTDIFFKQTSRKSNKSTCIQSLKAIS